MFSIKIASFPHTFFHMKNRVIFHHTKSFCCRSIVFDCNCIFDCLCLYCFGCELFFYISGCIVLAMNCFFSHSINIQLTEQSCVLKETGMCKRQTQIAIMKKHFEPITVECATSTLNTLSIKFLNLF